MRGLDSSGWFVCGVCLENWTAAAVLCVVSPERTGLQMLVVGGVCLEDWTAAAGLCVDR